MMFTSAFARRRRLVVMFSRAVTALCSAAGLVLFVVLLAWYDDRESEQCAYKYLPIVGLIYSVAWNLFAMVTYGMRSAKWVSRRMKLYADFFGAFELAVLGYLGFIYDVLNNWRAQDWVPDIERKVEVIAVTVLSLSGAAHLIFFCYGCTGDLEEPRVGPSPNRAVDSWSEKQLKTHKYEPTDTDSIQVPTGPPSIGYPANFDSPPLPSPILRASYHIPFPPPIPPRAHPYPAIFHSESPITPGLEPHHLDAVSQLTPTIVEEEFEDQSLMLPRPAPPLPERKRSLRIMTEHIRPLSVAPPVPPLPLHIPAPAINSPQDGLSSMDQPFQPALGRSASTITRLSSLTRKPTQHRRVVSTPDAGSQVLDPVPPYLPGGYVTNLEGRSGGPGSRITSDHADDQQLGPGYNDAI